ncbi:MAG: hypothetical protein ACMUJM_16970 [bacterium]
MVYKDNRIPPRGIINKAFQAVGAEVVGYQYEDGQFWDDTYYSIPETTTKVMATLYYQTSSKEYIEFLRDENKTNDVGEGLYKGSFEIVADENGLTIENLDGYQADGTPSNAFEPMKGKWSVPGDYIISPVSGPATGHPMSQ